MHQAAHCAALVRSPPPCRPMRPHPTQSPVTALHMAGQTGGLGGDGEGGGGAAAGGCIDTPRVPQSLQSVPIRQMLNSAPGPPSSQSPSVRQMHVSVQVGGGGGGGARGVNGRSAVAGREKKQQGWHFPTYAAKGHCVGPPSLIAEALTVRGPTNQSIASIVPPTANGTADLAAAATVATVGTVTATASGATHVLVL